MNKFEREKLKQKEIKNVGRVNSFTKVLITRGIDLAGNIFFFWKKFKSPPAKAKKILFISLYFNGDILLASPVFKLVRELYPDAAMDIWIKSRTKSLMEGYKDNFNKVIDFNDIRTRRYDEVVDPSLKKKLDFFKQLRKEKYDIVIDLTGLFWTAFAVFYMKARYSCGFNFHGFGFFYNSVSPAVTNGHLIDKNLDVILKSKIFYELDNPVEVDRKPFYNLTDESVNIINDFLKNSDVSADQLNIVFHTTAGWKAKEWDAEKFIEAIDLLNVDVNVFLIGGPGDVIKNQAIEAGTKRKIFNTTNNFSINQTAALIAQCDYYVGADSGPLYIAEALGVKTISLFGPTNPLFSAPRGDMHSSVYYDLFCSADTDEQNCKLIAGLNCKTVDCMKLIKTEDVLSNIFKRSIVEKN